MTNSKIWTLKNEVSLKTYNTFGISAKAKNLVIAETIDQLIEAYQCSQKHDEPIIMLGEGSNVLFTEDFAGTVVINRLKGIQITEDEDAWHLHVGGGENWHELVEKTLCKNMPGLENLALIPGCVGSAPVQNIGAYGVELKQVCDYIDLLNLRDGTIKRMQNDECQFGDRESVFKHAFSTGYSIVSVGFCLKKKWQPVLHYGELKQLNNGTLTPRQVFDAVCSIRRSKLPDPKINGNAGSFFKGPVVSKGTAEHLLQQYPKMPHYRQSNDGVKIPAGWLIDRCQLKGFRIGDAAVSENHALVIINLGNASGTDIVSVARHVRQKVAETFGIWLEPEVRFIAARGIINAIEMLT